MNAIHLTLFMGLFVLFGFGTVSSRTPVPEIGQPAPDFTLKDQAGVSHTLSDYRGEWVLVYFYPKDDTPGCTTEACSFRDRYEEIRQSSLKIFGISTDDVSSHEKFAEKYNLPFDLLADPDGQVVQEYGVKQPLINIAKRHSFLIDPDGIIRKIYEKVTPADHPEEILADLKQLQKNWKDEKTSTG
jgi:thioredoxin-dependent peroxiredoxin